MFKIVVATDLARLPDNVREYVDTEFDRLAFDGKARIVRPPSATVALDQTLFDDCDVVVTRPTGGLWTKIHPDDFEHNTLDRVNLFTVSAGRDSLKAFESKTKYSVDSPDVANEAGVAACAMMIASGLLFRSGLGSANIRRGRFTAARACTSLSGKTWAIYGSGRQVTELVELLHTSGLRRIIIYSDQFDKAKFDKCISLLEGKYGLSSDGDSPLKYEKSKSGMSVSIRSPRQKWDRKSNGFATSVNELTIEAGLSRADSFRDADVVSIHLPYDPEPRGHHASTHQIIDSAFLKLLEKRPVLVNVSRGEVLNEDEVLGALERGELSGVGVDVLDSATEHSSDHRRSKLWTALREQEEAAAKDLSGANEKNLIITPHIAGSVDTDVLPMWQDILRKIRALAEEAP